MAATLAVGAARALNDAIEAATEDGVKDAAGRVGQSLAANNGTGSRTKFFTAQKDALATLKGQALVQVANQKAATKQDILATQGTAQQTKLHEAEQGARAVGDSVLRQHEFSRLTQYGRSMSSWMNAQAQGSIGSNSRLATPRMVNVGTGNGNTRRPDAQGRFQVPTNDRLHKPGQSGSGIAADTVENAAGTDGQVSNDGTDIAGETNVSAAGPGSFGGHTPGIVYVEYEPAGGMNRPFRATRVRVGGITDAVRDTIKDVPIKDLGVSMVCHGHLFESNGFVERTWNTNDNELGFGRNEAGDTYVTAAETARARFMRITNTSTPVDAASQVINQDFATLTLNGASTRG